MPEQTFLEAWLLCMLSGDAGTAGAAMDMLDAWGSTGLLTAACGADAEADAWAAAGAGAIGEGWDASADMARAIASSSSSVMGSASGACESSQGSRSAMEILLDAE